MDISENSGTPKSSILIGVSIILTIHFGIPLFLETPMYSKELSMQHKTQNDWKTTSPWSSTLAAPQKPPRMTPIENTHNKFNEKYFNIFKYGKFFHFFRAKLKRCYFFPRASREQFLSQGTLPAICQVVHQACLEKYTWLWSTRNLPGSCLSVEDAHLEKSWRFNCDFYLHLSWVCLNRKLEWWPVWKLVGMNAIDVRSP